MREDTTQKDERQATAMARPSETHETPRGEIKEIRLNTTHHEHPAQANAVRCADAVALAIAGRLCEADHLEIEIAEQAMPGRVGRKSSPRAQLRIALDNLDQINLRARHLFDQIVNTQVLDGSIALSGDQLTQRLERSREWIAPICWDQTAAHFGVTPDALTVGAVPPRLWPELYGHLVAAEWNSRHPHEVWPDLFTPEGRLRRLVREEVAQ